MFSLFRTNKLSSTESVDIIEKIVYEYLKPLGFRKHGRTLHRFVEGDISQVVHLQNGCPQKGVYGILWVNLGIRVPECMERTFNPSQPLKKYYHEYECNIHTTLGMLADNRDTSYNLKKDPQKIGTDIVARLRKFALPVFDQLNSRQAILTYRKDHPNFDQITSHMIPLEDAMIYGRWGDLDQATQKFHQYYQKVLAEYEHDLEHGSKEYLRKGETVTYYNARTSCTETITASKSGYVTLYDASDRHLIYLAELAKELGLSLPPSRL